MSAPVMRLRRPRWKDPRLIVGVVLVVASVLMGALLVSRLAETTPVLVARSPIVPGDPIDPDNLILVEMRLGDQHDLYLGAIEAIPDGSVATRAVQAGELLPLSAVGQSADVPLRPIVIPVDSTVAESVAPGASVELWHTAPAQESGDVEAELLVERGIVRSIDEGSSLGMRSMAVEVLVPSDDLAAVLQVLSRDERLDVIGVPGAYGVTP
ncbi:SAF domain-containing protein [Brachybacterium alimentarium]|uniref:SAF domain-containing protein n=1 Tax=Brachybacterium alimentarium TaxID=47845 RepID=UPI0021620727|nr:SAF domain-containing protein [Brachybacterium alimentarium]